MTWRSLRPILAFVILIGEAFVFGRRICLQRIGAVSIALIAYAVLPVAGVRLDPLELSEWPLMFAIAILVAWMADHDQTVGRRYAGLYRETRANRRQVRYIGAFFKPAERCKPHRQRKMKQRQYRLNAPAAKLGNI